ncbi:MAG: hypothetical protein Q4F05_03205 [bacterium]|nr:hypothetical protein [bacterium]
MKELVRKRGKRIVALSIVVIACYFAVLQPVRVFQKEVYYWKWDDGEISKLYDGYNQSELRLSAYGGQVPSENPDDYVTVCVDFSLMNRSFFRSMEIRGDVIQCEKDEAAIIWIDDGYFLMESLFEGFSKEQGNIILDIYKGNLEGEALKKKLADIVNGITLKVSYNMDYIPTISKIGKLKVHSKDIHEISLKERNGEV